MAGAAADPLLRLAQSRSPTDRERLMQALAQFCDMPEAGASPKAQALIGDIFMVLIAQAEHEIRARLSATLAPARFLDQNLRFGRLRIGDHGTVVERGHAVVREATRSTAPG